MRVSQALDYALQALVRLARAPESEAVPAGELARSLQLPTRFVEQQVTALARAGIVQCRRGAGGGCSLARRAAEISLADVVSAIHGEVLDVPRQPGSAAAEAWEKVAGGLDELLSGITLADLAVRQRELDAERQPMYFI